MNYCLPEPVPAVFGGGRQSDTSHQFISGSHENKKPFTLKFTPMVLNWPCVVGLCQRTRREPRQTQAEHANHCITMLSNYNFTVWLLLLRGFLSVLTKNRWLNEFWLWVIPVNLHLNIQTDVKETKSIFWGRVVDNPQLIFSFA